MRRDAGRYNTGVAPLAVDDRNWRPKPLEAIVGPGGGGGRAATRADTASDASPASRSTSSELPWVLRLAREYLPGMRRAQEIADEVAAQFPGHNDLGDALRHAEWNRRMQLELGMLDATLAGYGHELENCLRAEGGGGPIPIGEILMDLHNNAEGRRAARAGRPINPSRLMTAPPTGWQDYLEQYR